MYIDSIVSKELIFNKGFTRIYRAYDNQKSYIIKENRSGNNVEILNHEYMISSSIDLNCILKPLSIEQSGSKSAIIYEDILGKPLHNHLQDDNLSFKDRLVISIKAAKILIELHGVGIIHNSFNLESLIYNLERKSLKVTDLTNSSVFLEEHVAVDNNQLISNIDLTYISPEQTGKVKKPVDYRTDLYSLGVSLFKLFTDDFPFSGDDMIDKHLNIVPELKMIDDTENEKFLSSIIMKLLEKKPEKRYQSAVALRDDLVKCLGNIRSFSTGLTDIDDRLNDKYIYPGREVCKILETLRERDKRCFFLLKGSSGSGKTTAIKYLQQRFDRRGDIYLKLSNSEITKLIPYLSISTAISTVNKKCIDEFNHLPYEILELIGIYKKERKDRTIKNENGIIFLFYNIIRKFFEKKKIVILIDDFDLLDLGSISVLRSLIKDTRLKSFIIVCSINDEKADTKECSIFKKHIEENEFKSLTLTLQDFNREEIKTLVSKTLQSTRGKVHELSQYIFKNTDGKPLTINLFLNYLKQKKLIYYSPHRGHLQWNLNKIKSYNFPVSTEGLITAILNEYSDLEKVFIQSASSFCYMFNREIVQNVSNIDNLPEVLNMLVTESDDPNFNMRFKSRDIHSFLLSNISKENENISKKNFARVILNTLDKEDVLKIFIVVYFLNKAKKFIIKDHEIVSLAELNLFCASHLIKLFKHRDALRYLKYGMIRDERIRDENIDITLKLSHAALKAAINSNDFKTADRMAEEIIKIEKVNYGSADKLILSVISENDISETKSTLNIKQFELPEKKLSIKDLSNEIVIKALKKFDGNKTRAAGYLGISRQALYRKLEKIKSDY